MPYRPTVNSCKELEAVRLDLQETVDFAARLPASPFRIAGTDSLCEFERFRAGTFGPLLSKLATQYNDEYILGTSVDPETEYYQDFYDTFGAFRLPATNVAWSYWDALSFEPNDDASGAILFSADVFCVAGSSRSWGIWGERQIGIAVVRTTLSDLSWRKGSDLFVPPDAAIRDFVEPNFNLKPLPDDFRHTFLRSFEFADKANIS